MDSTLLVQFFAWCALFNLTLLMIVSLMLITMREMIMNLHSRLFGVPVEKLPRVYLKYLGYYKLLIIFFNLVPYLSLRVII